MHAADLGSASRVSMRYNTKRWLLNIVTRVSLKYREHLEPTGNFANRRKGNGCRSLERSQEYLWAVWCTMMTSFAAQRTVLSVQKHTLANVRLHVTFSSLCEFPCSVTERAVRIGNFNRTPARTNWALLHVGLCHLLLYVESTII